MKKHLRRIVCVVMVLVLTVSLSACSADPNCGKYVCKTIQVSGESTGDITVDVNQVFTNGGASIELKEAGACDLILDGVKYEGSWKSDGSKINIKIEDDDIEGVVSGNTLTIDKLFDVTMTMNFEKA